MRRSSFRRALRRLGLAAALALPAALLAGCGCQESIPLAEDFEGCKGTCGWAITGGVAALVSTILPGEHGLQLDGGATAARAFPKGGLAFAPGFVVTLVASCPAGFDVAVSLTPAGAATQSVPVTIVADEELTPSGDVADFSGAAYLPFTGTIVLPTGITGGELSGLSVRARPGARCTIDVVKVATTQACAS